MTSQYPVQAPDPPLDTIATYLFKRREDGPNPQSQHHARAEEEAHTNPPSSVKNFLDHPHSSPPAPGAAPPGPSTTADSSASTSPGPFASSIPDHPPHSPPHHPSSEANLPWTELKHLRDKLAFQREEIDTIRRNDPAKALADATASLHRKLLGFKEGLKEDIIRRDGSFRHELREIDESIGNEIAAATAWLEKETAFWSRRNDAAVRELDSAVDDLGREVFALLDKTSECEEEKEKEEDRDGDRAQQQQEQEKQKEKQDEDQRQNQTFQSQSISGSTSPPAETALTTPDPETTFTPESSIGINLDSSPVPERGPSLLS